MLVLDKHRLWAEATSHKAAVVLLGGEMPCSADLREYVKNAAFLAAADGGAAFALELGRHPDLLIGDFDSLPDASVAVCREYGTEIVQLPIMKDMTDGEFLLDTLLKRGFDRLLVLGALGGRPDMELANIYCAAELAKRGGFCLLAHSNALLLPLYAEENTVRLEMRGFDGHTFSQLSLSDKCAHISLDGFLYPLDGELQRGQTLGLSNIIETESARLSLQNGTLLTVINLDEKL